LSIKRKEKEGVRHGLIRPDNRTVPVGTVFGLVASQGNIATSEWVWPMCFGGSSKRVTSHGIFSPGIDAKRLQARESACFLAMRRSPALMEVITRQYSNDCMPQIRRII
jgi:hypothetical protein